MQHLTERKRINLKFINAILINNARMYNPFGNYFLAEDNARLMASVLAEIVIQVKIDV